jgi:hypothetical protein
MSLLKFFLSRPDPAARVSQGEYDGDADLLAHPDIASMSQRELADLPLPVLAPKPPLQRQLEKCV